MHKKEREREREREREYQVSYSWYKANNFTSLLHIFTFL